MALFLALALSLLIVEADMPRRKTTTQTADAARPARKTRRKTTAADTLLQTLNPHAAGIDVAANELWGCLPPGDEPHIPPDHPDELPAYVRRFGTFTADLLA